MRTLFEGFAYIWREKIVLGAVSLDLFAVLLGGATALLPMFAKDILLVGPGGQRLIVMSDVGGSNALNAVDLVLSDAAAAGMPDAGAIASGSYRPTNVGANDAFPAPAPGTPHGNPAPAGSDTFGSVFGGLNADGTWNVFLYDDANLDAGQIGQVCLEFNFAP